MNTILHTHTKHAHKLTHRNTYMTIKCARCRMVVVVLSTSSALQWCVHFRPINYDARTPADMEWRPPDRIVFISRDRQTVGNRFGDVCIPCAAPHRTPTPPGLRLHANAHKHTHTHQTQLPMPDPTRCARWLWAYLVLRHTNRLRSAIMPHDAPSINPTDAERRTAPHRTAYTRLMAGSLAEQAFRAGSRQARNGRAGCARLDATYDSEHISSSSSKAAMTSLSSFVVHRRVRRLLSSSPRWFVGGDATTEFACVFDCLC